MKKEKYPLWIRLLILPIMMTAVFPVWLISGMISTKLLGELMYKTGKNLLKP
jgi:hypothetical protein